MVLSHQRFMCVKERACNFKYTPGRIWQWGNSRGVFNLTTSNIQNAVAADGELVILHANNYPKSKEIVITNKVLDKMATTALATRTYLKRPTQTLHQCVYVALNTNASPNLCGRFSSTPENADCEDMTRRFHA